MLATKGSKNPSPISNSPNNISGNNETHRLSIHYIDKENKNRRLHTNHNDNSIFFFLNWGIKEIERAVTIKIKIKWLEEVSQ